MFLVIILLGTFSECICSEGLLKATQEGYKDRSNPKNISFGGISLLRGRDEERDVSVLKNLTKTGDQDKFQWGTSRRNGTLIGEEKDSYTLKKLQIPFGSREMDIITKNGLSTKIKTVKFLNRSKDVHWKKRKRRAVENLKLPNITCTSYVLSCKNRCLQTRDPGGVRKEFRCSCDPYCNYFKDCCHDYVNYCLRMKGIAPTYSKVPDQQWSCRNGIWMITSCPKSWTYKEVKDSCTNITKMIHENYVDVLNVITPDNKTFANRFCAQCHGYKQHQMEFYPLEFKCTLTPPTKATNEEKMKFVFENCIRFPILPKVGTPRRYCNIISTSNCEKYKQSSEINRACLSGSYGLIYDKVYIPVTYKNIYCWLCNKDGYKQTNTSLFQVMDAHLRCGPGKGPKTSHSTSPHFTIKPFSLILDIGKVISRQADKASLTISCTNNEVYDWYLETCREGQQFVPIESNIKRYRVALWIKQIADAYARDLSIFDIYIPNRNFVKAISKVLNISSTYMTFVSSYVIDSYRKIYLKVFDLNIPNHNERNQSINVTDVFHMSRLTGIPITFRNRYTFNVIKVTIKPLTCVMADTYSPIEYQIIPGTSSIYINKTGEYLNQTDYFSNSSRMVQDLPHPVGHVVVCRQILSGNCSGTYIFLQRHEYIIFPNRSLLYKAGNSMYEYGRYTWRNGTAMICTHFTITYEHYKKGNPINDLPGLTILTYIGFSISVFSLVFVLVTYSLFPTLRTIPGINLMNLSCALLVAHLLWLVGSGLIFADKGCTAIAIVLHYSFLASFMWMSIIAFDTWRAFSSTKPLRLHKNDQVEKCRLVFLAMSVGWIPLVIFLSACVGLDQSGLVVIGYGGEKSCWINDPWANLYFFAIPVATALLWNAVFFILIVRAIRATRKQSQMVASQHQTRKDSAIYARIAVLMGFTWVFGFVAPFTSTYLMYPFVILNTLQGLYIAVAFCCTRRVRLLYRSFYIARRGATTRRRSSNFSAETKV